MCCFLLRVHCVQLVAVLVQEAPVGRWVPIIPTRIMQDLLVVLHSMYNTESNWNRVFLIILHTRMPYTNKYLNVLSLFTVELRLLVPNTVLRVGEATTSSGKPQDNKTPVSTFISACTFIHLSFVFLYLTVYFYRVKLFVVGAFVRYRWVTK